MDPINYNNHRIDEHSMIIMSILRDRMEPVSTGDLQSQTDLSQNTQVRYRLKTHLVPSKLVEHAGTREILGAGPDADLWKITDEGHEFLTDRTEDLTKAIDAQKAIDSLRRTRETMRRACTQLEEIKSNIDQKLDNWQKTMNNRSKKIHRVEVKVSDIETSVNNNTDRIDSSIESAKKAYEVGQSAIDNYSRATSKINQLVNKNKKVELELSSLKEMNKTNTKEIQHLLEITEYQAHRIEELEQKLQQHTVDCQQKYEPVESANKNNSNTSLLGFINR